MKVPSPADVSNAFWLAALIQILGSFNVPAESKRLRARYKTTSMQKQTGTCIQTCLVNKQEKQYLGYVFTSVMARTKLHLRYMSPKFVMSPFRLR